MKLYALSLGAGLLVGIIYSLLSEVARQYGKQIDICPDAALVVDRSLAGSRFRQASDYVAPAWPELIRRMHAQHLSRVSA